MKRLVVLICALATVWPVPPPLLAWQRAGLLLAPSQVWEAGWVDEPSPVHWHGHWFLFYGGGTLHRAIGLAEAPTLTGPWTKHTGPVLGLGASGIRGDAQQNEVIAVGDRLYCYYSEGARTGALRIATSDDGIHWHRLGTQIRPAFGVSQWANSVVWHDARGWHLLLEGLRAGVWAIWHAASPDGLHWHFLSPAPLDLGYGGAVGGPWVVGTPTGYTLYYHAALSGDLPTSIYIATSGDGLHWRRAGVVLSPAGGYEVDQVADPAVVGDVLLYAANDNVPGHWAGHILLATRG